MSCLKFLVNIYSDIFEACYCEKSPGFLPVAMHLWCPSTLWSTSSYYWLILNGRHGLDLQSDVVGKFEPKINASYCSQCRTGWHFRTSASSRFSPWRIPRWYSWLHILMKSWTACIKLEDTRLFRSSSCILAWWVITSFPRARGQFSLKSLRSVLWLLQHLPWQSVLLLCFWESWDMK